MATVLLAAASGKVISARHHIYSQVCPQAVPSSIGQKRSLRGLAGRKMPHGGKTVKLDAFKRTVKIAGQDTLPMSQPIPVFGMKQRHGVFPLKTCVIRKGLPTLESGFLI